MLNWAGVSLGFRIGMMDMRYPMKNIVPCVKIADLQRRRLIEFAETAVERDIVSVDFAVFSRYNEDVSQTTL